MGETIYSVLRKQLDDKADVLKDALHMGRAADHEDYKYMVGQLRGLMVARNLVTDLESSTESDDD